MENEQKINLIKSSLLVFSPLEEIAASLELDIDGLLEFIHNETGDNPHKFIRKYTADGLRSMRENLVLLAAAKPTAAQLLYKDLQERGLLGAIQNDTEVTEVEITVLDGEVVQPHETED